MFLFRSIVYIISLIAILFGGILLRIGPHIDFSHVADGNLSAYYFDKFNRIIEQSRILPDDVWEFAPKKFPENVPPGLPYFAAGIFKIIKLFFPDLSTFNFAAWFPVIVYLIFGILAFLIFLKLENSPLSAFTVLFLISFSQIFASYTEYAYFVQESLGTLFLFLAAYFIFNHQRSKLYLFASFIFLTFLFISWQQFPLFVFALIILIIFASLTKRLSEAKVIALIVVFSLIAAEFISKVIIGIDYSAFGMIKDIIWGAILFRAQDPDFLTAMTNSDWHHSTLQQFFRWYGPLGAVLFFAGIIFSLMKRRDFRYFAALIFSLIFSFYLWQFQKERIFVFGIIVLVVGMGVAALEEIIFKEK